MRSREDILSQVGRFAPDGVALFIAKPCVTPAEAFQAMSEHAREVAKEFADFILLDFEMSNFDDEGKTLCWVLAGTNQKYSTEQLFNSFIK